MTSQVRRDHHYELVWWEPSEVTGEPVERTSPCHFAEDEHGARRAHTSAVDGLWIRPGMTRPSVGPLVQSRWVRDKRGRWREDDTKVQLAAGADLAETVARQETLA